MAVGYTIVSVPVTAQSATYWSQTDAGSVSTVGTSYYYGQPSYNYSPDGTADSGDIPLKLIIEPQNPTESAVSAVEFTMAGQDYDEVAQQEPLNGFTWFAGNSGGSWPLPESIQKVQFWDSGIPGQVGNTVVVYAWLNPNFAVPYSDVEITLDIDGDVVPITSTPVNPAQIEFLSCPYQTGPDSAGYSLTGWFSGWPNVIMDYVTYTITNPCTDCFQSGLDYVNGVPGSGSVNNVLLGLNSLWTSSVFEIPFANSSTTQESCWTITLDPYSTNGVPTGSPSCTVCQAAQEPPEQVIYGCMDDGGVEAGGTWSTPLYPGLSASNFNENATNHMQELCIYPTQEGCMDENANNYNPTATVDDGSCIYSFENQGYLKISVVTEACSNLTVCSASNLIGNKRVDRPDVGNFVYKYNNTLRTLDWLEAIGGSGSSYTTDGSVGDFMTTFEDNAITGSGTENVMNIELDGEWSGVTLESFNPNGTILENDGWVINGNGTGCDGLPNSGYNEDPSIFETYTSLGIIPSSGCHDCENLSDPNYTSSGGSSCYNSYYMKGVLHNRPTPCNSMTLQVDNIVDPFGDLPGQLGGGVEGPFVEPITKFLIKPKPGYTLSRHNLWIGGPTADADDPANTGLSNENWTGVPDGLLENYKNIQVAWGLQYAATTPEPIDFGNPYPGPVPLQLDVTTNPNVANMVWTSCAGYLGTTFPSNVDQVSFNVIEQEGIDGLPFRRGYTRFNAGQYSPATFGATISEYSASLYSATIMKDYTNTAGYPHFPLPHNVPSNYQVEDGYGGLLFGNIQLTDTMYGGDDPLEPYVTTSSQYSNNALDVGYRWSDDGGGNHDNQNGYWNGGPETWFNEDNINPETYEGNAVELTIPGYQTMDLYQSGVRHLIIRLNGRAMPCESCGETNVTFNETFTVGNE